MSTTNLKFGTVKLYFTTMRQALKNSANQSCTRGMVYKCGRVKTWIAQIERINPYETAEQAAKRIATVRMD
jgi:hypothetical protein